MEDVEPERRISRRKRKLQQGVVIGVATVASLGFMSKFLSFLRRDEKPKKLEDGDIETLEAVLSGDAAKGTLPPLAAEVHVFANLENDEPSHEEVNGHEVSPPSSKDVDFVSKVAKGYDVTEDGEAHVSQDLVGDRDVTDASTPTTEVSEPSPVSHEEVNVKEVPHSNGEEVEGKQRNGDAVEPHIEDEGKHQVEEAVEVHNKDEGKVNGKDAVTEPHIEDAEQLPTADVVELHSGDEGKPHIEDAEELHTEDETKQNGDALEALVEDAAKLHTEDEEKNHSEDAVELQTENEAKPHTEEAEKPHSEDALAQPIEDAVKIETKDEGKQSSEDAVELPIKDEEKHQTEDVEELQTKDEGKLHIEEAEKLQS